MLDAAVWSAIGGHDTDVNKLLLSISLDENQNAHHRDTADTREPVFEKTAFLRVLSVSVVRLAFGLRPRRVGDPYAVPPPERV
jgi:hypothetical protein